MDAAACGAEPNPEEVALPEEADTDDSALPPRCPPWSAAPRHLIVRLLPLDGAT
jgi:hypothetical protein